MDDRARKHKSGFPTGIVRWISAPPGAMFYCFVRPSRGRAISMRNLRLLLGPATFRECI